MKPEPLLLCLKDCTTINLIKYLTTDSFIFEKDRILCKFSYEMLNIIEGQVLNKNWTGGSVLFELHSIIAKFIENQKTPVVLVGLETNVTTIEYLCKMFQIMNKYLFLFFHQQHRSDIQICYEEQFVNKILNNFKIWVQEIKEEYIYKALSDLYSFVAYYLHLFPENTFNLRNRFIDTCIKIILEIKKLPLEWRTLKHVRLIIESWGISEDLNVE